MRRFFLSHLPDARRLQKRRFQRPRLRWQCRPRPFHRLLHNLTFLIFVAHVGFDFHLLRHFHLLHRFLVFLFFHLWFRLVLRLNLPHQLRRSLHPPADLPVAQALVDRADVRRNVGQSMEHLPLADDRVDEVGIAVELVLNDVVEDLQQEEHQVVVRRRAEQEPRRTERLQQMQKLDGGDHRKGLEIR